MFKKFIVSLFMAITVAIPTTVSAQDYGHVNYDPTTHTCSLNGKSWQCGVNDGYVTYNPKTNTCNLNTKQSWTCKNNNKNKTNRNNRYNWKVK